MIVRKEDGKKRKVKIVFKLVKFGNIFCRISYKFWEGER